MDELKLYDGEYKFVSIIWDTEPIRSGELVRLCNERLGWKKSTTYTVLKKLCQKGVLKNENSVVTACVTREEIQHQESCTLMERTFHGSLPKFLTSFLQDRTLTEREAEELKALIDQNREEKQG